MPSATFRFGQSNEHEVRMVADYFGKERYFVNGKLVHSCWSLGLRGTREFQAEGHAVRIELSIHLRRVEAAAFVDGKLVASDLFAELNAKFQRQREPVPRKLGITFLIWFVVGLLIMVLLKAINVQI